MSHALHPPKAAPIAIGLCLILVFQASNVWSNEEDDLDDLATAFLETPLAPLERDDTLGLSGFQQPGEQERADAAVFRSFLRSGYAVASHDSGGAAISDDSVASTESTPSSQPYAANRNLGGAYGGPVFWVGNTGRNSQGLETSLYSDNGTVTNVDVIYSDAQTVVYIHADRDGDGEINDDQPIGAIIDYDDLHQFNTRFTNAVVHEHLIPTSFEFSKQFVIGKSFPGEPTWRGLRFDGFIDEWAFGFGDEVAGWKPASWGKHKGGDAPKTAAYLSTGVRVMQTESLFEFIGTGGILDGTRVRHVNDHVVVGPQLGVGWVAEQSIWRVEALILGLAGYGRMEATQTGVVADGTPPGALNRSATLFATTSHHQSEEEYFGWNGEVRLSGSCQVSQHWRVEAAYRWLATGPIYDAYDQVSWNIPNWGIQEDDDTRTATGGAFYLGVSYVR